MARSDVTGVLTGRGRSGVRGAHGGQTTCRPDERAATHEPRREAWARFSLTASEGTEVGGEQSFPPQTMPLWDTHYSKLVIFKEGSGRTFDLLSPIFLKEKNVLKEGSFITLAPYAPSVATGTNPLLARQEFAHPMFAPSHLSGNRLPSL